MSAAQKLESRMDDATAFLRANRFLAWEAKLLDERRFDEWLELIDENIVYEVPIRVAKMSFADEFASGACRIDDNKKMIEVRVKRLNCDHCWSESPPSRTLRVVGSVIVNPSEEPDVFDVESALIVYRQRRDDAPVDIVPVRRSDRIRLTPDRPRLLRRRVLVTETVLHTPNLGIFL